MRITLRLSGLAANLADVVEQNTEIILKDGHELSFHISTHYISKKRSGLLWTYSCDPKGCVEDFTRTSKLY